MIKKIVSTFVLTVFVLTLSASSLVSAQQSGLQISPLTFNFETDKGDRAEGKIVVTNLNNEAINYQIEAEDFAKVSDEGAPSFAGVVASEDLSTLSSWIEFLGEVSGQIAAMDSIDVNFVIDIPENAEPGGHYAAIFAKQTNEPEEGNTEIGVSSRVGTLILVSVPGDVSKEVKISEFDPPSFLWRGPVDFTMKVENIGSVHYDSEATITIEPILGTDSEIAMGTHTIIPGNARNYEGSWNKRFPFGRYKAIAQATNGDGEVISTEKVIWALPLEIVIPALLLLIIIIWTVKHLKKKYRIISND